MNDFERSGPGLLSPLTPRESDILALLVENKTNQEIAAQESLALSSVKWYVNQIFSKLGVKTRPEAIAAARLLELTQSGSPLPRNNLPRSLTTFIGREAEISHLLDLVIEHPLVTVSGVGGTGKTRLALKTAEKALSAFPDGVWLVELAPLTERELVPGAVLSALGLVETPGLPPLQALIEFLRPKQILILLDNCEHVIGAAAGLAHELLHACLRLHILATSREILGAEGEITFRCPSLGLPDPKRDLPLAELSRVEAVRLFCERGRSVAPGFALSEANAAVVARICRRLDGIPLAIELAAARLRMLSIDQIAARLDQAFRLLTGGSRTELPRHQTLKALIDWSYNLLSEQERLLLLRLSVFASGWSVEAAEAVCADAFLPVEVILDLLGGLLDKSLVGMEAGSKSGQPRYQMLETIRQYAHERLVEGGGGAETRERHLDYYLDLSLRAESELRGRNSRGWSDLLDEEIDNLRLAVEWALSGCVEKGLRLATALTWFLTWRHNSVGTDWLQRLLAAEAQGPAELRGQPDQGAVRGRALMALTNISTGRIDRAALAREAAAIFESLGPAYELDRALARSIWSVKDLPEILDLVRRIGDPFRIYLVLWPSIIEALSTGNLVQARIYVEDSLALCRQIGLLYGEMSMLFLLSWLELLEGHQSRAMELSEAADDLDRANGKNYSYATSFSGRIYLYRGDFLEARRIFEDLLEAERMIDDRSVIVRVLGDLARSAGAQGDFDRAEQYCQEAERFAASVADVYLCPARYAHALLAIARGEYGLACKRLRFLTGHWFEDPQILPAQLLLLTFGILAEKEGRHRRAAVLFGGQDDISRQLMNISTPGEREEYQQALSTARTSLGEEEFERAMAEGRAMTLVQAIQYALEERG